MRPEHGNPDRPRADGYVEQDWLSSLKARPGLDFVAQTPSRCPETRVFNLLRPINNGFCIFAGKGFSSFIRSSLHNLLESFLIKGKPLSLLALIRNNPPSRPTLYAFAPGTLRLKTRIFFSKRTSRAKTCKGLFAGESTSQGFKREREREHHGKSPTWIMMQGYGLGISLSSPRNPLYEAPNEPYFFASLGNLSAKSSSSHSSPSGSELSWISSSKTSIGISSPVSSSKASWMA